jgi:hypothetical protein
MKNILKVIVLLFTTNLLAQTHTILKHNGENLEVNYIKTEKKLIYYTLPNSSEEQKISVFAVAQLTEKSKNSSQSISEKIQLNQKSDYKKVIVLKESETIGLKKSEEINSFIGKVKGQPEYVLNQMIENRLKEKAASKENPFIVIVSNDTEKLKAFTYTY